MSSLIEKYKNVLANSPYTPAYHQYAVMLAAPYMQNGGEEPLTLTKVLTLTLLTVGAGAATMLLGVAWGKDLVKEKRHREELEKKRKENRSLDDLIQK